MAKCSRAVVIGLPPASCKTSLAHKAGVTYFLTRTLDKVRTEMSLHLLAYNLKRMIRIFGVGPLMAAIRA